MNGNWIDLILLAVILVYALEGLERGFFALLAGLVSFLGSLAIALRFYPMAANLIALNFSLSHGFANALGFIGVAFVSEMVLGILARLIYSRLPQKIVSAGWTKVIGIIPGILNGLVVLALILTFLVALPVSGALKKDVLESRIGGYLLSETQGLERKINEVFGEAINETITFLTIKTGSEEKVDLRFKTSNLTVDQAAENKMLELVNKERTSRGIRALVMDPKITAVARLHSKDMFENGYFSHISLSGKDPFQRMKEAGVSFGAAGENLALAPDVSVAHQGLMNSEGHKRNILDPNFRRVGIGVMNGGIYGEMFTQDFAD